MSAQPPLAERYRAALAHSLATPDEEALSAAYDLGRAALGDGHGVLDMATAHHEALATLAANGGVDAATMPRIAAFFSESIAAFDMAYRGFHDVNQQLQHVNADLEQRNGELLRAKEAAEAASRELEAFSYSVSHDLRAPLRTIDGFSLAVMEDQGDRLDDEGRRQLGIVREAASHMARLIDDLLRLARVSRAELHEESIDLGVIAERVVRRIRTMSPDRVVDVVIAPGLIAHGDPHLLEVALDNLIGNAWKFTGKREHARIEIGMRNSDKGTVYFVKDDGAGFDMTYATRLFTAFQRLHSTLDFDGTGIGLATVQRVIRRHGGHVWAESAVGQGATFSFTLHDPSPG